MTSATIPHDPNEIYRQTQSRIYSLQETILDSTKDVRGNHDSTGKAANMLDDHLKFDALMAEKTLKKTNEYYTNSIIPLLKLNEEIYKNKVLSNIGTLQYHPTKTGKFSRSRHNTDEKLLLEPPSLLYYNQVYERNMPPPFLPALGLNHIHSLLTVHVLYEQLYDLFNESTSPRVNNNEIWGSDIYTDDSDPLLALKHCGFSIPNNKNKDRSYKHPSSGSNNEFRRTPANLENPDNVKGESYISTSKKFDLDITILYLQPLRYYPPMYRNGIWSRSWGEMSQFALEMDDEYCAPHDGLSFGIYELVIKPRDG
ncbi:Rxt3p NDAI_0D04280 [Naumovozyma dairenensis CBS 421]|uniref:Uncharacterized protein n=1 Tax=Naumovozyma dairenensis (strain ATCC 10597 / BCRC 20456 / CBS 421 / NBRC 0211 / NRRL Y-12639) TaxID=1071378 RepID=G0WAD1_NAUDC|nr:hypothetical protein NDAI_0D04280 [Naumovozyma dairenensis CBS 421]CCD24742.1 hypothetical protein NDAI_0D04280 [Naumovozyma dairenensis CBS 421]